MDGGKPELAVIRLDKRNDEEVIVRMENVSESGCDQELEGNGKASNGTGKWHRGII
ncbi:hypothetical protein RvY_09387 [Ramazzottius varieornatus]|uniref:Uncharacterized protein n=1 Tax=Ramazzottius varieornatus TaxID=947166 RepID=A0A1D1VBC4_RAMVA|nr:hypothetical protein RvY_09387 [Ramazzottius varieornatus]